MTNLWAQLLSRMTTSKYGISEVSQGLTVRATLFWINLSSLLPRAIFCWSCSKILYHNLHEQFLTIHCWICWTMAIINKFIISLLEIYDILQIVRTHTLLWSRHLSGYEKKGANWREHWGIQYNNNNVKSKLALNSQTKIEKGRSGRKVNFPSKLFLKDKKELTMMMMMMTTMRMMMMMMIIFIMMMRKIWKDMKDLLVVDEKPMGPQKSLIEQSSSSRFVCIQPQLN